MDSLRTVKFYVCMYLSLSLRQLEQQQQCVIWQWLKKIIDLPLKVFAQSCITVNCVYRDSDHDSRWQHGQLAGVRRSTWMLKVVFPSTPAFAASLRLLSRSFSSWRLEKLFNHHTFSCQGRMGCHHHRRTADLLRCPSAHLPPLTSFSLRLGTFSFPCELSRRDRPPISRRPEFGSDWLQHEQRLGESKDSGHGKNL